MNKTCIIQLPFHEQVSSTIRYIIINWIINIFSEEEKQKKQKLKNEQGQR